MSVPATTYHYNATYNFNVTVQVRHEINGAPDVQQALADVLQSMKTQVQNTFAEKLIASGHWFKVNSTTTTGTTGKPTDHINWYGPFPIPDGWDVPVSGQAVVDFDCDVQDMMAHNSPQLWEIIIGIAEAIVGVITANPLLFLIGCIVIVSLIVIAVVLFELTNLTTAITKLFETTGGAIAGTAAIFIGGIVLIIAVPLVFEYLSGRSKRKSKRGG
jgi:hypothetical protein